MTSTELLWRRAARPATLLALLAATACIRSEATPADAAPSAQPAPSAATPVAQSVLQPSPGAAFPVAPPSAEPSPSAAPPATPTERAPLPPDAASSPRARAVASTVNAFPGAYPDDPMAGCRAPSEPGCSQCCMHPSPSSCTLAEGEPASPSGEPAKWPDAYVRFSNAQGMCPPSCTPCARCSLSAERELKKLHAPAACDCAKARVKEDPCSEKTSCACYCVRREQLEAQCPPKASSRH